jgi:hypothetical protein
MEPPSAQEEQFGEPPRMALATFLVGLLVGVMIGVLIMAALVAGGRRQD